MSGDYSFVGFIGADTPEVGSHGVSRNGDVLLVPWR